MRREDWDSEAAPFDSDPDHGLADPLVRAAWRELLVGVLPLPPARVVDLGCGTGALTRLLFDEGHAVDGIDIAGLSAEATESIVRTACTEVDVVHLSDSMYWGRQIADERYLVVGRC
jgi:2-polyprenyl-3-methyl-5-hydroxy-6-metoxy-1,4-benzoquinol methylase